MSSLLGAAILLIVKLLYEGESADGERLAVPPCLPVIGA